MKAINFKLASFTFAAMLLASCSDSNDTPNSTPINSDVIGKEVTSITDAQTLAARVRNFKSVGATRAAGYKAQTFTKEEINLGEAASMEAEPTNIPTAKLADIESPWVDNSGSYVIKKGDNIKNKTYNFSRITAIYIDGTVDLTDLDCNNNNTILYITKNGRLKNFKWGKFKKVYNYGTIEFAGDVSLEAGSVFKSKNGINMNGKSLTVKDGVTLYIGGNLEKVQNLSAPVSDGGAFANIHIAGNLQCSSNLNLEKSNVLISGSADVKDVILRKNTKLKVAKNLKCNDGKLDINASYAEISTMEGEQIRTTSGAKLQIAGTANLSKGGTFHSNASTVEIGGKLTCKIFENEANATTNLLDGVDGLEDYTAQIDGIVNIEGNTKLKKLSFVGNGQLYTCSLVLSGDLILEGGDGGGSALHTTYLKAKSILVKSSTNIYLTDNGMIECEGTLEFNKNGSASVYLQGKNAKALIRASVLKFNGSGSESTLNDCYVFNALMMEASSISMWTEWTTVLKMDTTRR